MARTKSSARMFVGRMAPRRRITNKTEEEGEKRDYKATFSLKAIKAARKRALAAPPPFPTITSSSFSSSFDDAAAAFAQSLRAAWVAMAAKEDAADREVEDDVSSTYDDNDSNTTSSSSVQPKTAANWYTDTDLYTPVFQSILDDQALSENTCRRIYILILMVHCAPRVPALVDYVAMLDLTVLGVAGSGQLTIARFFQQLLPKGVVSVGPVSGGVQ